MQNSSKTIIRSSFKSKAREHQIQVREDIGLHAGEYETYLKDNDARSGLNFYSTFPGLLSVVDDKYHFDDRRIMYKDMLRSEQIPFNLFAPLKLDININTTSQFITLLIDSNIPLNVKSIEVEWSPPDKTKHLNDNTSFDTFVLCHDVNQQRIGIGVEVKYTERSYPYGKTEKRKMDDLSSIYYQVTQRSNLYRPGYVAQLKQKEYKQIWRNHLLGESMIVNKEIDRFYSVHMYPEGNTYQKEAAYKYSKFLQNDHAFRFVPLTFERFIDIGRTIYAPFPMYMSWLEYLQQRYIVS